MVFTEAQRIIIREICSMEFTSLESILERPLLGEYDEDFTVEEILAQYGCTRKDFDESLLDCYHQFQVLHDTPEGLFELKRYEMLIFIQLLHLLENNWKEKYPNALINLWNKIFIWETINDIRN
jgi:FPC/CPF motif-containing protein YcgG